MRKAQADWGLAQILSIALVLLAIGIAILIYMGLFHKLTMWSCCYGNEIINKLTFRLFEIRFCAEETLRQCV